MARLALAVLLLFTSSACVSFNWGRDRGFSPPPEGTIDSLQPGETELDEVLAKLGGPIWVQPNKTYAAVIAYGWEDTRDLGGRVSVPVTQYYSASYRYDDTAARLHGVLLFFDEDWILQEIRIGWLPDLIAPLQQPTYLDEFDADEKQGSASDA